MKSFRAFSDTARRKYVSINVAALSQVQLRSWCRWSGFDISTSYSGKEISPHQFDFHTTIFYTDTIHDTQTGSWRMEPFEVDVIGFELLGEKKDVPVLLMDDKNPNLIRLRADYEAMGFKDKWPVYKPHLSVSYSKEMPDIDKVKKPDFKILFNRIIIDNIK